MTDVIVECRGGVVQEVTVVGAQSRVFIIDWDESEQNATQPKCLQICSKQGVASLTAETRSLYEASACSNSL